MAHFMGNLMGPFGEFLAHLPGGGLFYNEEAAVQAAMEASRREQTRQPKGPPPVSKDVLRTLPHVKIAPDDLVDPVNRECAICLEQHPIHSTGLRLPCAHIFHVNCIRSWLISSCTCPVCRYELPTDDPEFERERVERMKARKPRFAMHELQRLPLKRLKELLRPRQRQYKPVDRQDLIDLLVSSGSIEFIASPEPVQYSLSTLQQMSIKALKQCMHQAGVFFDPKDVVEKDDMIRIFMLSGRLMVTAEEVTGHDDREVDGVDTQHETDSKPPAVSRAPIVETVSDTQEAIRDIHSNQSDQRENHNLVMEEVAVDPIETVESSTGLRHHHVHGNSDASEETRESPEQLLTRQMNATSVQSPVDDATPSGTGQVEYSSPTRTTPVESSDAAYSDDTSTEQTRSQGVSTLDNNTTSDAGNDDREVHTADTGRTTNTGHTIENPQNSSASVAHDEGDRADSPLSDDLSRRGRKRRLHASVASEGIPSPSVDETNLQSRFRDLGIGELQSLGRRMSIDLSDCIERTEMIRRLSSADRMASQQQTTTHDDSIDPELLDGWSISELRTAARLIKVDMKDASAGEDMVAIICQGTVARPQRARLLHALAPLMGLSISQLRATARERRIDLSTCLEKDDILLRIVEGRMDYPW